MSTLFVEDDPTVEALLARRRELGLDGKDEVWEGVYHVAPHEHARNGITAMSLTVVLDSRARRAGLQPGGSFNLGGPHDFRVPDLGFHRPGTVPTLYCPSAALVVEVLSPDDETFAKFAFYAGRGVEELWVVDPLTRSVRIWQLDLWKGAAVDDLDAYVELLGQQGLRRGIEADFIPGREDRIANLLDARPFDYVIGSVHFLGDLAVDHLGYDIWDHTGQTPDAIWRRYFETLGECGRSGLFDILAHPDLVKVWGGRRPKPDGDLRRYYELAIEGIVEGGAAIEISTAGLRKPVGELYPASQFLTMCIEAGCDVTISSDAHVPADVGSHYEQAIEFLGEHGVTELTVFEGRQRRKEPIG